MNGFEVARRKRPENEAKKRSWFSGTLAEGTALTP